MTLTCPTCHAPFTLAAVPAVRAASVPAGQHQAPPANPAPWTCPAHGTSKTIPAGISKKSGRPYGAFAACDMAGCPEKGPFGSVAGPPRPPPDYTHDLDDLPF